MLSLIQTILPKTQHIFPRNWSNNSPPSLPNSQKIDGGCPENYKPNDASQQTQSLINADQQDLENTQLDDVSHESAESAESEESEESEEFPEISFTDLLLDNEDCECLGYLDWPGRQPPDLKPPFIHPILLESSGFWGSKEEYTLMEPAIRIATQLLFLPRTRLFVYSLVYETKRLPSQFDFDGLPCSQFRMTKERDPAVYFEKLMHIYNEVARNNRE